MTDLPRAGSDRPQARRIVTIGSLSGLLVGLFLFAFLVG